MHACMYKLLCVRTQCTWKPEGTLQVFYPCPPYFILSLHFISVVILRQSLFLNLEFTHSERLASYESSYLSFPSMPPSLGVLMGSVRANLSSQASTFQTEPSP